VTKLWVASWVLLLSAISVKISWADCPADLAKLASASSDKQTSTFASWSFKERNLSLTPSQIFPPDYIKAVEEKLGPLEMEVTFSSRESAVKIRGIVRNQTYFTVSLFENLRFPGKLLIDQLRLENPLEINSGAKLGPDQRAKGLPPETFRFIQRNIFELAKAGGHDQVFTNSQQHFAVAMLYRRIVGMEPAEGAASKLFSELEKVYLFARRELPESFRPKDVQEFTEWLGTVSSKPAGYKSSRVEKLERYFKTGELDPSVQIYKDKEGNPICAVFTDEEKTASKVLFIYHFWGQPRVLDWLEIATSKTLGLVKKL